MVLESVRLRVGRGRRGFAIALGTRRHQTMKAALMVALGIIIGRVLDVNRAFGGLGLLLLVCPSRRT
jgi:ABC-type phosphate transport system permease subunit